MPLEKKLLNLKNSITLAIKQNIDLNRVPKDEKAVYDYKEKQKIYAFNNFKSSLKIVKSLSLDLPQLVKFDMRNQQYSNKILELMPELESRDLKKLDRLVDKLIELSKQLNYPKEELKTTFQTPKNIPSDIESDINADINELNKCFNANCYRSSAILCGRLLETALHRKYYEVTNNDLLEKSPGIGLGNIIAKLKEKNISLDPALTNQIHLINQVRVFSVHKKKEAFCPSKEQSHAVILYTLDILQKLFS
ncbi:MAG: DUF4145 domain-containing protein [Nanoarchaeota archaeon]|nr:DUF4145 domain-containing protein [Nanoarchaeota archaeon]